MSDSASLKRYVYPKAHTSSFRSLVSGSQDPDISVDVGTPVTPDPDNPGQIYIADGTDEDNSVVIGLAASANEAGQQIAIQYAGPLSQPTTWWDRLTGQTGGLTPGARYYITNTPKLLSTSPDGVTFPVQVGIALSTDTLLIQIATFVSA